jgi:acetoin utilization deacetylase AcuC-like enzyme
VARSLPYTTGSMLSAARHVLRHGGAACAPCSGFHHASFESSWGYCTFNGLMVTAAVLRQEGLVGKVGIIDCDTHPGDGTQDIISRLGAASWVRHFTAGEDFDQTRSRRSSSGWAVRWRRWPTATSFSTRQALTPTSMTADG